MKTRAAIVKDARRLRSGVLSPRKLDSFRKEVPSPKSAKPNKQVTASGANTVVMPAQEKDAVSAATKDLFTSVHRQASEARSSTTCSTANVNEMAPVLTTTCRDIVGESSDNVVPNMADGTTTSDVLSHRGDDGIRISQDDKDACVNVTSINSITAKDSMQPSRAANTSDMYSDLCRPSTSGLCGKQKKLRITTKVLGVKKLLDDTGPSPRTRKRKAPSAHDGPTKTTSIQDDTSQSGYSDEGGESLQKLAEQKTCGQQTEDGVLTSTGNDSRTTCRDQNAASDVREGGQVPAKPCTEHDKHAAVEAKLSGNALGNKSAEESRLHLAEQHFSEHGDVKRQNSPSSKSVSQSSGTAVPEQNDKHVEGTQQDAQNSDVAKPIESAQVVDSQEDETCEVDTDVKTDKTDRKITQKCTEPCSKSVEETAARVQTSGHGIVSGLINLQGDGQVVGTVTHDNRQEPDTIPHDVQESHMKRVHESPQPENASEQDSTSLQSDKRKRPKRKVAEKYYRSSTSASPGSSNGTPSNASGRKTSQKSGGNAARGSRSTPRRILPARHSSLVQASLDAFVAKKPYDESSDSTAMSCEAHSEDDVSTSSSEDPLPQLKRRRGNVLRVRCSQKLVKRRDVATQCIIDDSSSNIWFEFYEAEPKERGKMHKRNHFTQTNAHTIARLDYKKSEMQPSSTRKYYCGVEGCVFKGMPSEIIAHVKARHVSYKLLVCKSCKKRHETLALFICHLGSKSCSGTVIEDDDGGSSSGGEDIVEVGSDDDAVPDDDVHRPASVQGSVQESAVKSPDPRHIIVVLTEKLDFLRGILLPQCTPLLSLGEVSKQLKTGITYTKKLFWLSAVVDVNYLCTVRHGSIKMKLLRGHPHALYRKIAPFLDVDRKVMLSSLLQQKHAQLGCLPKSDIRVLVLAARIFLVPLARHKACVSQAPTDVHFAAEDDYHADVTLSPCGSQGFFLAPDCPSPSMSAESDIVECNAVQSDSSERRMVVSTPPEMGSRKPLSEPAGTTDKISCISQPISCEPVLQRTSQALLPSSGLQSTTAISYVIPVMADQNVRSCLYMTPTKVLNQMLMAGDTPRSRSVNARPSQHNNGRGKFPKLAPKMSSPYTMRSFIHKLDGRKLQGQKPAVTLVPTGKAPCTDQMCLPPHPSVQTTSNESLANPAPTTVTVNSSLLPASVSTGYIISGSPSLTPLTTGYTFSGSTSLTQITPGYIFRGSPPSTATSAGPLSWIATPSSSNLTRTVVQQTNVSMMTVQSQSSNDGPADLRQKVAGPASKKSDAIQRKGCLLSESMPSRTSLQHGGMPEKETLESSAVSKSQTVSVVKAPSPSGTLPYSILKYRDAFQSALERAMRCSENEAKNNEVNDKHQEMKGVESTPSTCIVTKVFLCECNFQSSSKGELEEHIRAQHIDKNHGCRICSVNLPGLKQLENHFLQHVKIVSKQQETTPKQKTSSRVLDCSTDCKMRGSLTPASGSAAMSQKVTAKATEVGTKVELIQPSGSSSPSLLVDLDDTKECAPCKSTASSEHKLPTESPTLQDRSVSEPLPIPSVDIIDISSSDEETSESELVQSSVKMKPPLTALRSHHTGPEELRPFFKCVIDGCTFTADAGRDFAQHFTSHPTSDLSCPRCIYCGQKFDVINSMVAHMTLKHGRRVYQCGWCLYRAASERLLMLHLRFLHDDREPVFYKCDQVDGPVDPAPELIKAVDYCCGIKGCKFRCLSAERFAKHYQAYHRAVTVFRCTTCNSQHGSVDALIEHFVVHDLNIVQCAYCPHGTATFQEMLVHVCEAHADCELHFVIRTQQERDNYKEFVDDASNRAVFVPGTVSPQSTKDTSPGLTEEMGSPKLCPFCEKLVTTLSDIMEHCAAEHKISLSITIILDMLLQKAKADSLVYLGCHFCEFKGTDSDDLKAHLYQEFSYTPNVTNDATKPCNRDFEQWIEKLVKESGKLPEKLTEPYACVQCQETFQNVGDLRVHLYCHKKYFPHHCGVCAESFTTEEEAIEHQRLQHKMETSFLVQEVRLTSVEQVVDEAIEVQVSIIQERMQNSKSEHCIWNECRYRSFERATLLRHMRGSHLLTHHRCSSCNFASYSEQVMQWHSKSHLRSPSVAHVPPPVEVLEEAHATPIPKPRGSFKCGYCKFRGDSSIAIREHAAIAHRGLPVKLVVPPRPTNDILIPALGHVTTAQARAPTPVDSNRSDAKPSSVRSTSTLSYGNRSDRPLRCNKCAFVASSQEILAIHRSNLHQSDSDEEVVSTLRGSRNFSTLTHDAHMDDASVSSTTPGYVEKVHKKTSVTSEHTGASQSAKIHSKRREEEGQGSNPSCSGTPKSTAKARTCTACHLLFPRRTMLLRHLARKHHVYAMCDYCEKTFMNKKQVTGHSEKVHPSLPIKYSVLTRDGTCLPCDEDSQILLHKEVEGFSWYRHPVEPLDLNRTFVTAMVPGTHTPMRLGANAFFAIHSRKPVLRIKDFTKLFI